MFGSGRRTVGVRPLITAGGLLAFAAACQSGGPSTGLPNFGKDPLSLVVGRCPPAVLGVEVQESVVVVGGTKPYVAAWLVNGNVDLQDRQYSQSAGQTNDPLTTGGSQYVLNTTPNSLNEVVTFRVTDHGPAPRLTESTTVMGTGSSCPVSEQR